VRASVSRGLVRELVTQLELARKNRRERGRKAWRDSLNARPRRMGEPPPDLAAFDTPLPNAPETPEAPDPFAAHRVVYRENVEWQAHVKDSRRGRPLHRHPDQHDAHMEAHVRPPERPGNGLRTSTAASVARAAPRSSFSVGRRALHR
jgi:hypothetical protein